jgi:hypothetical protein
MKKRLTEKITIIMSILFLVFLTSSRLASENSVGKAQPDSTIHSGNHLPNSLYIKALQTIIDSSAILPFPTIDGKNLNLISKETPGEVYLPGFENYKDIQIKYSSEFPDKTSIKYTGMRDEDEFIILTFSIMDENFRKEKGIRYENIAYLGVVFKLNCNANQFEVEKLQHRIWYSQGK